MPSPNEMVFEHYNYNTYYTYRETIVPRTIPVVGKTIHEIKYQVPGIGTNYAVRVCLSSIYRRRVQYFVVYLLSTNWTMNGGVSKCSKGVGRGGKRKINTISRSPGCVGET